MPIDSAKDKIRTYIFNIKEVIDRSSYKDSDKSKLLEVLGKFEKELDARRISLLSVLRVVHAVLLIPPVVEADYLILKNLTSKVIEVVDEMKTSEDAVLGYSDLEAARQLAAPTPLPLPAPRKKGFGSRDVDNDVDDEIPF